MEYIYAIVGGLFVGFVIGFFVGGKHKERVMRAAGYLKDTIGKL
jgi:hypothetical protein